METHRSNQVSPTNWHIIHSLAYFSVHWAAIRSCSERCLRYIWAISPTSGSAGLHSCSSDVIDNMTAHIGMRLLYCSFKISRQMSPCRKKKKKHHSASFLLTLNTYPYSSPTLHHSPGEDPSQGETVCSPWGKWCVTCVLYMLWGTFVLQSHQVPQCCNSLWQFTE